MQVTLNRLRFSFARALAGLAFSLGSVASAGAQELPNIVIIYADDLGYGDLSCYNPKAAYKTPRLDRMAKEGIRFTDAHSPSTICSPSRYGLYSGQLVCRTGRGPRAFEGPGGPSYLEPGELTIADMVRKRGYRTGVFGKWHVGLTWLDESGKQLGGQFQIRKGDWKYLDHKGSGGNDYSKGILRQYALPETAPEAPGQLYNLAEDPGETTNLFFSEPEKRRELQALLKKLTAEENGRSAPKNRKPMGSRPGDPAKPNALFISIDDLNDWQQE